MIRRPNDSEKEDCVKLIYTSGPNMFSYFLILKEPDVFKSIEVFYTKPDVMFSSNKVFVKTEDERVCGLLLSFPAKDMDEMSRNMGKYGKEIFQVSGFANTFKMLFRGGLQKYLNLLGDDEYYINNLAVFDEYRGKGYGVELLNHAEVLAREQGFKKLSLIVEFYNTHAKKVYEKFGFCEEKKVDFPKKYHKHSLDGIYKMVKILN